ncbi:MAG: hypothetical protein QOI95_1164 [Acidimicrobiaceae bacterium]|jgi:hypothetical protein
MGGCLKAFLIVGGAFFVLMAIVIIAVSSATKEKTASNEASCAAVTYADHQTGDQCADAQSQVKLQGYTMTATNVRREPEAVFGPEICADVTYLNRADAASSYNEFEWKLQTPSGVVQSFELTDASLGSGQIVPGGTKSGTVCFKDNAETGQFVLIWKGEFFQSDRGIWIVNL